MSIAVNHVSDATKDAGLLRRLFPAPEERILMLGLAGMVAVFVIGAQAVGQAVDWAALGNRLILGAFFLMLGLWLRRAGWDGRLALAAIALGYYALFARFVSLSLYFAFPLDRPVIDPLLERIDAALGYHWQSLVLWVADYPLLARVLAVNYVSALFQLLIVLLWLAATRRRATLHRFLSVGSITVAIAGLFWLIWPSFGPAMTQPIPADAQAAARLVINDAYVAELHRLIAEGNALIGGRDVVGMVAFPSYHMVMACLVAWFSRGTWLFWPALLAFALMVPATMIHGGHHAIDLIGGVAVFAATVWVLHRRAPVASGT